MAAVDVLPTVSWLTSLQTSLSPLKPDTDDVGRRCRWNLKVRSPAASFSSSSSSSKSSTSTSSSPSSSSPGSAGVGGATKARASPYRVPNAPRYWSSGTDYTEDGDELDASRPSFSFTCLIGLAILSADGEKRLTVGSIYEYIQRNFPYFQTARSTWRNSVRHVLSLNKFFQKPDDGKQAAKGGVWEVKPFMLALLVEHIAEGQQRLPAATAKHLGLPELKRRIVKSRIGKMDRRRRRSATASSCFSSSSQPSFSAGSSLHAAAPPPPPPVQMAVVPLQLDVAPEPFAVERTYECPSPALSSASSRSDSDMSDGAASWVSSRSSNLAQVPDLSDVELDSDLWPTVLDSGGNGMVGDRQLDESAMIDQILAKLAAEDAAVAGDGADCGQLLVLGEAVHPPDRKSVV